MRRVIARELRTLRGPAHCDGCSRRLEPGERVERTFWINGRRAAWSRICCYCGEYARVVADARCRAPDVIDREYLESLEPATPTQQLLRGWLLRAWREIDENSSAALFDAALA